MTQVETSEVGVECEQGSDEQDNDFAEVSQPSYPRTVYLVTYSHQARRSILQIGEAPIRAEGAKPRGVRGRSPQKNF